MQTWLLFYIYRMKKSLPLFSLLLIFFYGYSQLNYTNRWYFGINAGLDFSSGSPVAITGPTQVDEGTATICDAQGNVIFYSDGTQIWNRNNQVMPNGAGVVLALRNRHRLLLRASVRLRSIICLPLATTWLMSISSDTP